ncbi:MAG: DUF3467 domain-containing protein [Bacteroidales bacterium]|nr:DUF3467 domain-containing protein [Bacteroidales bacterium]MDE7073141.1 DUF3467 domain-containing protein [Bacteroidales bacterium]
MEKKDAKGKHSIQIELSPDVAEGVYANLAMITHSQAEFVVDFIRVMPGVEKARVKSRIILTPHHAKRLMKALSDNVHRYESTFGTIQEPEVSMESFMNMPSTEA